MSQFISDSKDYNSEFSSEIDFGKATLLEGGGSTCDIYKTRWQRRTVFVKRLKEELRGSPLYLDALEKEYDVGVELSHPSLPKYLAFHRDYIVTEFIDGHTLAQMIKENDAWLKNEDNALKLLKQLIDAVAYLHRHHIVHCDIKPDNIMITSQGSNLVLFDFDKCYTDAFNDTSGTPARYGLPEECPGSTALDFRGIGEIAGVLGAIVGKRKSLILERLAKECSKSDVAAADLLAVIDGKKDENKKTRMFVAAGFILLTMILIGAIFISRNTNEKPGPVALPEAATATEESVSELPAPESGDEPAQATLDKQRPSSAEVSVNMDPGSGLTQEAKARATIIEPLITSNFEELRRRLSSVDKMATDPGVTSRQLLDSLRMFVVLEEKYMDETFNIINKKFPGLTDKEAWLLLTSTGVYPEYRKWALPVQEEIGRQIGRRAGEVDEVE